MNRLAKYLLIILGTSLITYYLSDTDKIDCCYKKPSSIISLETSNDTIEIESIPISKEYMLNSGFFITH